MRPSVGGAVAICEQHLGRYGLKAARQGGRSVEKIMRHIIFVVALLCLSGCCASRSAPPSQMASAPKKQLYTDTEAQAFRGNLLAVKYPTTIRAACSQLGIELARLGVDTSEPPRTQLLGLADGGMESHISQLSDSYSIGFHHNISEKTSEEYQIHKIRIWKFKNRAE